MLHIPNSAEENCSTEKENHKTILKATLNQLICRLPKYNMEKQCLDFNYYKRMNGIRKVAHPLLNSYCDDCKRRMKYTPRLFIAIYRLV